MSEGPEVDGVTSGGSRIYGVDAARGIAIVAMFMAHALPHDDVVSQVLHFGVDQARAQAMFAVLDGLALGLLTGGGSVAALARRTSQRRGILIRGVFLIALGLTLSTLGSRVAVILDYYGIYFLLVLPMLYLSVRWLLIAAAAFTALGPFVSEFMRQAPQELIDENSPIMLVTKWLFTGTYPACMWLGFVLAGLAVARLDITSRRTQALLAVVGLGVMVGGYSGHLVARDLAWSYDTALLHLGSTGLIVAAIAALVFLTTTGRFRRAVKGILFPMAAMGAIPITVYTLHVIYLAVLTTIGLRPSWSMFVTLVLGSAIFASLWVLFVGKGPLERVVRWMMGTPATPVRWV
ncbi:MAG: heparan-alpha-glucosaminide N-acetyltransferase domain-containing protein [Rhodoglobus sp.]